MRQIKATRLVTGVILLAASTSAFFTCPSYKQGRTIKYKDPYIDLINNQTSLQELQAVGNGTLRYISNALRGWQGEVRGTMDKYLQVTDEQVQFFEDNYEERYVRCPDYTSTFDTIYMMRSSLQEPKHKVFARLMKNRAKKVDDKYAMDKLRTMVKDCRDDNDDEEYRKCSSTPENLQRGKQLLTDVIDNVCKDANKEVENMYLVGRNKLRIIADMLTQLGYDIDKNKTCKNY